MQTGFGGFDRLCRGVRQGKPYLIYGNPGLGKTIFALTYLHQGLSIGERAVLVTSTPAPVVLDLANSIGLDLEHHLADEQFVLLEFPFTATEPPAFGVHGSLLVQELLQVVGEEKPERIVFDPVLPLIAALDENRSAETFRSLVNEMTRRGVSALYVADLPGGRLAASMKSSVFGVLRFEAGEEVPPVKRLLAERTGGEPGEGESIAFEIVRSVGMVAIDSGPGNPAGSSSWPLPPPVELREPVPVPAVSGKMARILVAPGSAAASAAWWPLLNRFFEVHAVAGMREVLEVCSSNPPDLLLLANGKQPLEAVEAARGLRKAGRNLPVVLAGSRLHRNADCIRLLDAGVDVILPAPVDRRILLLQICNQLRRNLGPEKVRSSIIPNLLSAPDMERSNRTDDLNHFLVRASMEAAYLGQFGLPLAVLALSLPSPGPDVELLVSLVSALVRSTDLMLVGTRGVGLLLAEAGEYGPFLQRLRGRWSGAQMPAAAFPEIRPGQAWDEALRNFLIRTIEPEGAVETGVEPSPESPARNVPATEEIHS